MPAILAKLSARTFATINSSIQGQQISLFGKPLNHSQYALDCIGITLQQE
jgi:hypothetical protein